MTNGPRSLKERTTIPIVRVHGFGRGGAVDEENPTGRTFVVLNYIPGKELNTAGFGKDTRERRNHFYSQLIDVLAQLRQLEFDAAGSLMPCFEGGPGPIIGKFLNIYGNDVNVEHKGEAASPGTFSSAINFCRYQYRLMRLRYQVPAMELGLRSAQREVFEL